MFIIFLKFSENFSNAKNLISAHNEWVTDGVNKGIFQLVGSIVPNQGGAIIASNISREEIDVLIKSDPFVIENVVKPEIIEISPNKASSELQFLLK